MWNNNPSPPGSGYQGICDNCGKVGHKWRECQEQWVQQMQVEGAQGWEAGGSSDKAVTIPNAEAEAVEVERDSWDLMAVRTSNYWQVLEEGDEEEKDEWKDNEDVRCRICDDRSEESHQARGCEECGPFIELWPSL